MRRAELLAALLAAATACGPVLYHGVKRTRTYEYERPVTVVVDSDPAGATIVAADGSVLGQAPVVVEERVRVRRKHRSSSEAMAVLGCLVDGGVFTGTTLLWDANQDELWAQAAFAGGIVMLTGCVSLAVIKLYNLGLDPAYRAMQSPLMFTSPTRTDEEVLPRKVQVKARWESWAAAAGTIQLPEQRHLLLSATDRHGFDEALIFWERSGQRAPGPEGLYRLGLAYLRRARAGARGASERARDFFTRYLATPDVPVERSAEVRMHMTELDALGRVTR
jgi:hypothetical protein